MIEITVVDLRLKAGGDGSDDRSGLGRRERVEAGR